MEESNKKQSLEESVALLLSQNERTKAMLDGIATKADENFIKIESRLGKIEGRLGNVEGRLGNVEGRLGKVEARLNSLSAETSTNFTEVGDQLGGIKVEIDDQLGGIKAEIGDQLGSIKAELVKIGAATRYEQFHEDQKKFDIPN
jgi:chromosome segregation ATPase